jgi:hypothetical protein
MVSFGNLEIGVFVEWKTKGNINSISATSVHLIVCINECTLVKCILLHFALRQTVSVVLMTIIRVSQRLLI